MNAHVPGSDGLRLWVEDSGAGPALLCLPGLTRNARDFDFVAPHLGDCRLIRVDYRGRGRSDFDPDPSRYSVPQETADVICVLDRLGLERVTVLGTSRGGLIAMMLAAAHRDRLAGVILNDVGPELSADGLARILALVGKPPTARSLDEVAREMQTALRGEFPGVPLSRFRALAAVTHRETARGLELTYDPRLAQALAEQAKAGPPPDLWPLFDALKGLPLGVIRGANSDILSAETLARMRARRPDMTVSTVPDRGHAPFLDEPDALGVIRAILEAR